MSGESECLVELKRPSGRLWKIYPQDLKLFFRHQITVLRVKCTVFSHKIWEAISF